MCTRELNQNTPPPPSGVSGNFTAEKTEVSKTAADKGTSMRLRSQKELSQAGTTTLPLCENEDFVGYGV